MRSALPYRGLTAPQLRATLRPILADPALRLPDRPAWEAAIRLLWDGVAYREEWYGALAVARHRAYRPWRDSAAMPLWHHLVVTGAWWDVVDETATHLVRDALDADPALEAGRVREWAAADDLWLRRAAIICQVGRGERTDEALLADAVEANLLGSPYGREFFVRKAIGWALRDHARVAPDWVRAFVAAHADRLSPLSTREALKHL